MSILTDSMAGLMLTSKDLPQDVGLDVVIAGPEHVFAFEVGWWTIRYGLGAGLFMFEGGLDKNTFGWFVRRTDSRTVQFIPPEPSAMKLLVERHRQHTDIERDAYLKVLDELPNYLGEEFNKPVEEWIALVKARPVVDALTIVQAQLHRKRAVGSLTVEDENGKVLDVLVVDEDGDFATSKGNSWLDSIGSQWGHADVENRPTIQAFLEWASEQRPRGLNPGKCKISTEEGSTRDIALGIVPA